MTDARLPGDDEAAFIAAARSNDAAQLALITERYRRELQVHCYRMLANYEDAQDMTQETFLRVWNKREPFKGHAALRTCLYRIATNACLDFLDKRNGGLFQRGHDDWRCIATTVNRMPAAALYLRAPDQLNTNAATRAPPPRRRCRRGISMPRERRHGQRRRRLHLHCSLGTRGRARERVPSSPGVTVSTPGRNSAWPYEPGIRPVLIASSRIGSAPRRRETSASRPGSGSPSGPAR
ncbi:sigma factor [Planomonospora alba]|uniref:sigma factor n=1 Tax=Planomonospora alba TaxID=161354 RepID=UPI0031E6A21E